MSELSQEVLSAPCQSMLSAPVLLSVSSATSLVHAPGPRCLSCPPAPGSPAVFLCKISNQVMSVQCSEPSSGFPPACGRPSSWGISQGLLSLALSLPPYSPGLCLQMPTWFAPLSPGVSAQWWPRPLFNIPLPIVGTAFPPYSALFFYQITYRHLHTMDFNFVFVYVLSPFSRMLSAAR